MPYAIELFFDTDADAKIRRVWDDLAMIGSSFMRDSGARPHVSLAVYDSLDASSAQILLDRFASTAPSFSFTLNSLGVFVSSPPVAFLSPKVSHDLLHLHSQFFSVFSMAGFDCWPHYTPTHWVPHCTIAMDLEPNQLPGLHEICQTASLPITGIFTEIGIVEFRPVRHLHSAPLTGPSPSHR
jgi:2'-5' RNA ligase